MLQKPQAGIGRDLHSGATPPLLAGLANVAGAIGVLRRVFHVLDHVPHLLRCMQGILRAMARWAKGAGQGRETPLLGNRGKAYSSLQTQASSHDARQVSGPEAELHRANLRLETAMSNMSQGLCLYDADGRLDVVNQQFFDIYHLDPNRIRPGALFRDVLQTSIDAGNYPGRTADELVAER